MKTSSKIEHTVILLEEVLVKIDQYPVIHYSKEWDQRHRLEKAVKSLKSLQKEDEVCS